MTAYIKYPRTPHLPNSPGRDDDDISIPDSAALWGCDDVVVTLKMDGENTTVYPDGHTHARSVDSLSHPSRTWMRAQAAQIAAWLSPTQRLCGENLYAKHSIHYHDLRSWFYAFSLWDTATHGGSTGFAGDHDGGVCASFDDLETFAAAAGICVVDTIYRGPMDAAAIDAAFEQYRDTHEGYVVRDAGPIKAGEFNERVAKWVRPQHVTTSEHWLHQQLVRNELA